MGKPASLTYVCGTSRVFDLDERGAACYLAALIDGEGCVYVPRTGQSAKRSIQITNTDWDIIEAAVECCRVLRIHFTIHEVKKAEAHWANGWCLMISGRKNLRRAARLLPIRARRKRDRLSLALESYSETARSGFMRVSAEERDARVDRFREDAWHQRGAKEMLKLDALVRGKETAKVEEAKA